MTVPSDDDGFTSVTYKKPIRAPKNRKGKNRFRERTLEEKLLARRDAMRQSGYLQACREMLRTALAPPRKDDEKAAPSSCPRPVCVVCLGLGSLSESTKAQDQYVLLRELIEELGAALDPTHPVAFYDPVFTPEDVAYLGSQGHSVLPAEYPLALPRPTLLYIPHGPRSLFDALLRANWSPAALERMILLGNRLDLYDDPTYSGTTSQSGTRAPSPAQGRNVVGAGAHGQATDEGGELAGGQEWITKAAPLFHIVPMPPTRDHLEAFNDLALEWTVPSRIAAAEAVGKLAREHVDLGAVQQTKPVGKDVTLEQAVKKLETLSLEQE
ncbi:hypothetical protein JCM21900_000917 [Sporobolomyces salmonicolor]